MLGQTDLERERYEARRGELDFNTGMKAALREGRAEGEKLGIVRAIHLCQRLLRRAATPAEQLTELSLEELTRLADQLEAELVSATGHPPGHLNRAFYFRV